MRARDTFTINNSDMLLPQIIQRETLTCPLMILTGKETCNTWMVYKEKRGKIMAILLWVLGVLIALTVLSLIWDKICYHLAAKAIMNNYKKWNTYSNY